jgi:hypothetical protein
MSLRVMVVTAPAVEVLEREPNALRLTIFGVIVRLRLRPEAFRMEIASA